jgi:hypothetical protein
MRLGEWYDSIRDEADLDCTVCGAYFCTKYKSGTWRKVADKETGEEHWFHWCGNQWHPAEKRVRLTRANGEVLYIAVTRDIKEVACPTSEKTT